MFCPEVRKIADASLQAMQKKDTKKNTGKWNPDPLSLFSHELKTPLSTLKMGLDLLKKNPAAPKNKKTLQLMEEELNWLIAFIENQLDFKLLKEKKDLLKQEWSCWKPSLSSALRSCRLNARGKNILFQVNGNEEMSGLADFEVFMDPEWMTQALKNLLFNALRFAPENSRIFIDYRLLPEGELECSVTDEGQGFSEKDQSRLFEMFYTGEEPRGRERAGLGLAIVKTIVEAHGGSVKAFSSKETGKGASFRVQIPKVRAKKHEEDTGPF